MVPQLRAHGNGTQAYALREDNGLCRGATPNGDSLFTQSQKRAYSAAFLAGCTAAM
jgi:hypothetical protein